MDDLRKALLSVCCRAAAGRAVEPSRPPNPRPQRCSSAHAGQPVIADGRSRTGFSDACCRGIFLRFPSRADVDNLQGLPLDQFFDESFKLLMLRDPEWVTPRA